MLIAFSGIDGGGKSTQIARLQLVLQKQGKDVVVTKAYDDDAKQTVKRYVHAWADLSRMFLFQAMHARQYEETKTAIDRGAIVIADRWDESFIAYHSQFGPLAHQTELREALNKLAFQGAIPDIGFLIEMPVVLARKRREARGFVEKLENRSDEWYELIQEGYRSVARERRWHILDGQKDIDELHNEILQCLSSNI